MTPDKIVWELVEGVRDGLGRYVGDRKRAVLGREPVCKVAEVLSICNACVFLACNV